MESNNSSEGLWGVLVSIFKVITGILLLYYFFMLLIWYFKGHFGKYFIFFWTWTILSISLSIYEKNKSDKEYQEYCTKYGNKSGSELFEESLRSGESYNK